MLVRSRCLFPVAEEATDGVINSIPPDTCFRCPDAKVAHGLMAEARSGGSGNKRLTGKQKKETTYRRSGILVLHP